MTWGKSDKIALGALVTSIFALFISVGIPLYIYWDYDNEKLSLFIDAEPSNYINAYAIRKEKSSDTYVKSIARWYKLQIANNSRKTISITKLLISEGNNKEKLINGPVFSKIKINNQVINISKPMRFPLKIEPGEAIKGYILIPTNINPRYGKILLKEFRISQNQIDTNTELVIYDPDYLKKIEDMTMQKLKNDPLNKFIESEFKISAIDLKIPLIKELENDLFVFGNSINEGKVGFIHKYDSTLMVHAGNTILENKSLSFDIAAPIFSKAKLILVTGNKKRFPFYLRAGASALDPLIQTK